MEILKLIICAVVAYLLGDIQSGLIVGKLTGNVDLRQHGSGSSGATNALRVLGKKPAALTFAGDFLKGVIATALGLLIAGPRGGMVACVFVVVGHIWPALYGFRGGKGVATSIGALLIVMPWWASLAMIAVGAIVLLLWKIVSLASLSGAAVFLVYGVITAIAGQNWFLLAFALIMTGLVTYAHRQNIARLRMGTETRIRAAK